MDNLRSLVKKQTYGNGAYRTYDYDAQDRVTAEYVNGVKIASYVYDKLSRVYKYTDVAANVTYTYEYDLIGRVLSITASDGRAIGYSYDTFNRTKELKQSVAGVSLNNKYHYNAGDGSIKAVSLNGSKKLSYTYDGFGRQNIRKLYTTTPFITEYTFLEGADGNTTTLVKTVKNGSETLQYSYDKIGNITSISKNGTTIESYTYDSLNQLATVTRGSDVYEYTYDNGGNILSVKLNGEVTKSYTYGDTNWKDKLTAYNGQTITYDAIGNPLTYRDGYTFTWANGRQLSTVTNGTNSYSYTYNADGLRTSKTVNGTKTEYYWMGSVLQGQKTGSEYILYLHDENGNTYGFLLKNGTTQEYYYYIFNAQGDVIGILNSAGTKVVEYTYSAWGEVLSVTGTLASTIGQSNPIRYRGYYYDNETGFYYCNSRYYDPETCRWVNADVIIASFGYVHGNNMFAYCDNNAVVFLDSTGNCKEMWEKGISGPCPGPGRCSDYDSESSFRLFEYRDVTDEIDNALNKAVIDAKICRIQQLFFGDILGVSSLITRGLEFYNLVNHGAPWDIKRESSWEATIGTNYPGWDVKVKYHGMNMTPEQLGNYAYGYIGAAYGFEDYILIGGSYYAAGFPTSGSDLRNEIGDWGYVILGYNQYFKN